MKSLLKKYVSILLRTVICVGAMCWVLWSVSLKDTATLPDGREAVIVNWIEVEHDSRLDDPCAINEVSVLIAENDQPVRSIRLGELARSSDGRPQFHVGLISAWKSCDLKLFLVSLALMGPVVLLQSIRFTIMMRAQDIELSYWEGTKLSFAGNFFNYVALGSTGGDIFKAYYVAQHTDRKTEAVTMVLIDRAVGLVGLILIAAGFMLVYHDNPEITRWWTIPTFLVVALTVGTVAVFSHRVRRWLHVDAILDRLPFSDQIKRIDAATRRMRHHKKLMVVSLVMTLVLQMLAIASFIVAGFGLGMKSRLDLYGGYFVYIAIALLIAAIPVSPQGLGTMDGALQIFLRGTYGNYSQVLFLGFAIRLVQLIWSLPGILVPITGAHRPSSEKIAQLQSPSRPSEL